jgi:phosphoenolpyruvate carboxykinase (GTP)
VAKHHLLSSAKNAQILKELGNPYVSKILTKYISLCKPAKVTLLKGTKDDQEFIRWKALQDKEEKNLQMSGHTVHYDSIFDQGRDKENTKILLPKGKYIGKHLNSGERDSHLKEVLSLLKDSMTDKELYVLFFCLGPQNSRFSIPALQLTDSSYVAHTEMILYRQGFNEFKKLKGSNKFFHFIHSSGELENGTSKNHDKRRIYIDLIQNRVFSVNCQYAGNTAGLKKLSLRLAIQKAFKEGWLCEHMLLLGVPPKKVKNQKSKVNTVYFAGAFPSACGKTSTAMIPGQSILGDDIAYLRTGKDGHAYGVNVEQGIFGIIADINPKDDPLIYKMLNTPREVIFSNILVKDGIPYWLGMGRSLPKDGVNFAGNWHEGITDRDGNEILPAHKNARYTLRMEELPNCDPNLHDKNGVPVDGLIYGGRDTDASPPVVEAFDFPHGVFMGASLESETTAATLGQVGVRKHNPMSNLDFLVVPLGKYIQMHLKFGGKLKHPPHTFTVNYFLKENGQFLSEKTDKKVWLLWMAGRIRGEYKAIKTPIGYIPIYEDLKVLFKKEFKKDYSKSDYIKQFEIRTTHLLEKLNRIEAIYHFEEKVPEELFRQIRIQRIRLVKAKNHHKKDIISPFEFI